MSEWNPGQEYRLLLSRIQDVLDDGKQRTTRRIYYALEARGTKYEYRKVKRAVKKGRRAGYIDPEQIVDTSRQAATKQASGWSDPESFTSKVVDGVWDRYFENFWKEQDTYVEVWLEKAGLAPVFEDICNEWNVRLEATRGDWSDSKIYRATQRLNDRLFDGKDVRILYFGDFNPSGLHAPVAVQSTMSHYGLGFREDVDSTHPDYFDIWPWGGPADGTKSDGTMMFERVAMNLDHIEQYDFPENPTPSSTDKDQTLKKRFMAQVSDGRDTNVELDAFVEHQPETFESMIEDAITKYVDEERKEAVEERMESGVEAIDRAVSIDWDEVSE